MGGGKEIFEIKKTKNSRKSIFPLKFKGDQYFFSKLKCWNMDIFDFRKERGRTFLVFVKGDKILFDV